MTNETVIQRIIDLAIVPAVRTPTAEFALRAINALAAGGITTMEIPVTVPGALDVIRELRRNQGHELLIGAGTVLDSETARTAILAGAQFIVSPALNLQVIACCKRYSIPVFAGALTPTEILIAWEAGADIVKIFPAVSLGGASYIKALSGPLPQIKLMPMGGVVVETVAAYLQAGACALGVGADLVSTAALAAGSDHLITEKAREYIEKVTGSRRPQPIISPEVKYSYQTSSKEN